MEDLRVATTQSEKLGIYRFRYRVFAQHLARSDLDGLDHVQQTLSDQLDSGAQHFYYGAPGVPVASITFSPLAGAQVPPDLAAFLDLGRLREAVAAQKTGLVNWLLVDPAQTQRDAGSQPSRRCL